MNKKRVVYTSIIFLLISFLLEVSIRVQSQRLINFGQKVVCVGKNAKEPVFFLSEEKIASD